MLGWGLTIFFTIEYIGYVFYKMHTRELLEQILQKLTDNRNNVVPYNR
jgi:hypothetical protein